MSEPEDLAKMMNDLPGWVREMEIRITKASPDGVEASFTVAEKHLQGYGIVHGGVYCGIIETLASVGAALVAMPRGQRVVGLENSTSFLRAVRAGAKIVAEAHPITRGRSSQLWEATVSEEGGKLVARGTVRLLCIDAAREL